LFLRHDLKTFFSWETPCCVVNVWITPLVTHKFTDTLTSKSLHVRDQACTTYGITASFDLR